MELINELNAEVGVAETSCTEFLDQIGHPDWKPEERLFLAFDDNALAGYADCWIGQFDSGLRATISLGVRAAYRNAGTGSILLEKVCQAIPEPCRVIDIAAPSSATELIWFLSERSFVAEHATHRMQSSIAPSASAQLPDGFRWHPFDPARDREAFRLLHNLVFADTFRWRPITAEAMDHYLGTRYFSPHDIRILEEEHSKEWVGFYWADVDPEEWVRRNARVGYIETLGVVPSHRGRGLGRFLLTAAKAALHERGCESAELSAGVKNDHALKIYDLEGFAVQSTSVWMSSTPVRCTKRISALRPTHGYIRAALQAGYAKFLHRRETAGATLPQPPFGVFRDWLRYAAVADAATALGATGMTLSDFIALRGILPDVDSALRALLLEPQDSLDPEKFYRNATCEPRYVPNESYGQCFDEPNSALFRAMLVSRLVPVQLVRVLLLGDTDCVAPILTYMGCRSVHTLDVDDRVLAYSERAASTAGLTLCVHQHDLRRPLPRHLEQRFDVVLADPPCTPEHIMEFARAGVAALRKELGEILVLAVTPSWLGSAHSEHVQRSLLDLGLVLVEQHASVLESRLSPSAAVENNDEVLPDLPAVFSDVWVMRTVRAAGDYSRGEHPV